MRYLDGISPDMPLLAHSSMNITAYSGLFAGIVGAGSLFLVRRDSKLLEADCQRSTKIACLGEQREAAVAEAQCQESQWAHSR
jgi:hypothetical protein